MDRFLSWAFGARTLSSVTELLDHARRRADALRRSPHDAEGRHELAGLLRRIGREAEERLWRTEADQAGSLSGQLAARRFEAEQWARFQTGFLAFEGVVRTRVSRMELLITAGAPRPAGVVA
jgi:hypothetical protein